MFQVLLLCLACSSVVECCTGLVSALTVICTYHFTQKHKKLAIGRALVICPPPKSFLIINSLEKCLSVEAWCLLSLQKCTFIHFHTFKHIQSLLNHY